jgi:hypothetical protein
MILPGCRAIDDTADLCAGIGLWLLLLEAEG